MRYIARRLYYLPQDLFHNDQMSPPKGLIYTGGGNFKETGQRFVEYFKEYASLKTDHDVLDIGSGIGRMALPLTKYISNTGSYTGVDLVEKGITWCQKNISTDNPNFKFQLLDLDNDLYLKSDQSASTYSFPFEDNSFDTIILISVFTHMEGDAIGNYLNEINRMLRSGGRCFFTCFHYKEQERLRNNPKFSFEGIGQNISYMSKKVKMANVALERNYLDKLIDESKLKAIHSFSGNWDNPTIEAKDFQDIMVVEK